MALLSREAVRAALADPTAKCNALVRNTLNTTIISSESQGFKLDGVSIGSKHLAHVSSHAAVEGQHVLFVADVPDWEMEAAVQNIKAPRLTCRLPHNSAFTPTNEPCLLNDTTQAPRRHETVRQVSPLPCGAVGSVIVSFGCLGPRTPCTISRMSMLCLH